MSTIFAGHCLRIEGKAYTLAVDKTHSTGSQHMNQGDTNHLYVTYACPLLYFGNHRNVLM